MTHVGQWADQPRHLEVAAQQLLGLLPIEVVNGILHY